MINTANLSLEQAPPIAVPFRFFLTAPVFGAAAGLLLVGDAPLILASRWGTTALAVTHLLTLGVLAMVMCGAVTQMLPVLAGAPMPAVRPVGAVIHALLSAGIVALTLGFLTFGQIWLILAAVTLGAAFATFVIAVFVSLLRARARARNPTVAAMALAVTALAVTAALGLALILRYAGVVGFGDHMAAANIHLGWGLAGWVTLLIIGVAYQVIPMFHITPEYATGIKRWLVPALFAGLALWSGALWFERLEPGSNAASSGAGLLLSAGYALFAVATLRVQQQRRRPVADVTLMFWRLGLGSLLVVLGLWLVGIAAPETAAAPAFPVLLGVLAIVGFALSVITGMLYKIVPFLCWFHLQSRQLALMRLEVPVPNMKELSPDRPARLQFALHCIALVLIAAGAIKPQALGVPAGLALTASFGLLGFNLVRSVRRYRQADRRLMAETGAADAA